jgi:hypothetical protein
MLAGRGIVLRNRKCFKKQEMFSETRNDFRNKN